MKKETIYKILGVGIVGEIGLIGYKVVDIYNTNAMWKGIMPYWMVGLIFICIFTNPIIKSVGRLTKNIKSDSGKDLTSMISKFNEE